MPRFSAVIGQQSKRAVQALLCHCASAHPVSAAERGSRWRQARRVLLLSGAGIGDALMATPLLCFLRHRYPHIRLGVITHTRSAPVFRAFPRLELICYHEDPSRITPLLLALWRCWRFRADVFLGAQPCNTLRHALFAAISRARLRLKHVSPERSEPDTACIFHYLCPTPEGRHRVELNLDLLRALGENIPEGTLRPVYPVADHARQRARQLLPQTFPWVALHPGGGRAQKWWGTDNFRAVAHSLCQRGYGIVLLGGRGEEPLGAQLAAGIQPVVNLTGQLDLAETAAVLQHCRLFIGNDSGLMHLAAAVGTPVVAIFVATDPAHVGPYSPMATVLGDGRGNIPTVEHVLAAAEHWLSSTEHEESNGRS
ncbi:Lipopolysaccharide core heptosyltransferase RfaQ [bacterium HR21]|nr:Lipopolysaccharide core heptosyltransferase RfaQ [bacterium HR21]